MNLTMKQKEENSAGGIVYKIDEGNKLWLITQHSQHKGWGFPKGLIGDTDATESMESAAVREVREEGGIVAKVVDHRPTTGHYNYQFGDTLVDKTVHYYLMEYVSGDPNDHDWEVSEAKFVDADEVRKTLTYKTEQDAFEELLKR